MTGRHGDYAGASRSDPGAAGGSGTSKPASMKKEMLKYFSTITSISFGALLLALILTVVLTNNQLKNDSSEALENQIEDQAHATLSEAGSYVTQFLNMYEESVVTMVSQSAADTFRSDYCLSLSEPSYFDYRDDFLATPLTQDSRQIKPVSFSHSSYYVTGSTPADLSSFGATINDIRNRTTHLDTFFRHTYETNEDLVGIYTGFHADASESFFRHYPGTETDFDRTYDPVNRPWYSAAVSASPNGVFTSPYSDSFGKGWMITCSRVILDESDNLLGVVGADILIASINKVLDGIKFLEDGKLTLFEESGQVVSDPEWDTVAQESPAPFRYYNLTSPAVSLNTWNGIKSAKINEKKTVSFGGYKAFSYHLPDYDGKYYLVVFVKESEILEPMDEPIEDLDQANASISILLVVITFVVFVVLMVVILAIINQILRTFSSMERNVDALLANVGCPEKNLADGMVDVAHVHIAELQNMSSNMNTVITNLRNVRQQQADTTSNPAYEQSTFFNDLVPFAQIEMTSMPVAYVVPTPSAPPPN
jgi:hypothetical protein